MTIDYIRVRLLKNLKRIGLLGTKVTLIIIIIQSCLKSECLCSIASQGKGREAHCIMVTLVSNPRMKKRRKPNWFHFQNELAVHATYWYTNTSIQRDWDFQSSGYSGVPTGPRFGWIDGSGTKVWSDKNRFIHKNPSQQDFMSRTSAI